MSNWKERVFKAFSDRNALDRQKVEEERRKSDEETRALMERETKRKRGLLEARELLTKIGARELLKRVRDVWGVGNVVEKEIIDGATGLPEAVSVALVWERQGKRITSHADQAGNYILDPPSKGTYIDEILISATNGFGVKVSDSSRFRDRAGTSVPVEHGSTILPRQSIVFVAHRPSAEVKSEVEETLLAFCESRIRNKRLPRD